MILHGIAKSKGVQTPKMLQKYKINIQSQKRWLFTLLEYEIFTARSAPRGWQFFPMNINVISCSILFFIFLKYNTDTHTYLILCVLPTFRRNDGNARKSHLIYYVLY